MTPDDLDLAAALRQLLRHPLVRAELQKILAEIAPAAGAEVEGFISTAEAARRAGVTKATLAGWIRSGVVPATRLPRSRGYRVRWVDVEAVLAGNTGHAPVLDLEQRRKTRSDALAAAARKERDHHE